MYLSLGVYCAIAIVGELNSNFVETDKAEDQEIDGKLVFQEVDETDVRNPTSATSVYAKPISYQYVTSQVDEVAFNVEIDTAKPKVSPAVKDSVRKAFLALQPFFVECFETLLCELKQKAPTHQTSYATELTQRRYFVSYSAETGCGHDTRSNIPSSCSIINLYLRATLRSHPSVTHYKKRKYIQCYVCHSPCCDQQQNLILVGTTSSCTSLCKDVKVIVEAWTSAASLKLFESACTRQIAA